MLQPSKVMALVPAYEAAGFIQATLDSLSAQTYPYLTVLISVDVCDDGTYETCLAHSDRDPRFQVFRQQGERLGYSGNCNFLIAQADSDYAMLAFHDDLLEPTFTEKLSRVLDERPDVILAFPDTHLTWVDGSEEHWEFKDLEGLRTPLHRGLVMQGRPPCWWVPNRGMFRLDRARSIGGIKPHRAGEFAVDYPWLLHMSLLGEFARVPEVLVYKRVQPRSLSRSWEFNRREWFEVTASAMRELWNADVSTDDKIAISQPLLERLLSMQAEIAGKTALISRLRRRLRRWLGRVL
jgi:glycosyltransferase involved in cell wall biosynthesis